MKSEKTITIRDVAKAAQVSPGTVSRALNGSSLVNQVTRQHILEVVEALKYSPNPVAQRLSTGKTLAIGIIVPYLSSPSASERLYGAIGGLANSPYDLVIHDIEFPERRAANFRDILRRERVDGALVLSLPIQNDEAELLITAKIPIVLIDTDHVALTSLNRITVDDVTGARTAVDYLLMLGHTRIGFVGDRVNDRVGFVSSRKRYEGYQQALAEAGIAVRPEYYSEDKHSRLQARIQARSMLALVERPTAILAASDTQAIGTLEAAADLGLRVPQDLSVIGYDDIETAEILKLTTMRQHLAESGRLGVQMLLESIANPDIDPVNRILPTELIVRGSTASPAV